MTAPIVIGLSKFFDGISLTLRSEVPERWLRERIPVTFRTAPPPPDPAMAMLSPFDVDAAASAAKYNDLFDNWNNVVKSEAEKLRELEPDLVLANVPFVSIAAAKALRIPAAAFSSLNWADVYKAYCLHQPEGRDIHARILEAYRAAEVFLRPTPSMPMDDLPNRRQIGPVARLGCRQRQRLKPLSSQGQDERFVLVSFDGIGGFTSFHLPQIGGVRWFVPDDYDKTRGDITRLSATGLSFIDLLASCDVVVTKPGYGVFVESACNGVKVAYVPRRGWPEASFLTEWLQTSWVAKELRYAALLEGAIADDIEDLLSAPTPKTIMPTGTDDALTIIAGLLHQAKKAPDCASF